MGPGTDSDGTGNVVAFGCEVKNNDGKCSGENIHTSSERRLERDKERKVETKLKKD